MIRRHEHRARRPQFHRRARCTRRPKTIVCRPVVHTDGTIFTVDSTGLYYGENVVDLIDPLTGLRKAQIGVENSGVGNLIIAGDGNAYLPYVSYAGGGCPGMQTTSLELLRMDTSGGSTSILLGGLGYVLHRGRSIGYGRIPNCGERHHQRRPGCICQLDP